MNYVDNNFLWLINEISSKNYDEVYEHIKNKYDKLPVEIKGAMEKFLNDFGYWGKLDYKNSEYEQIENKAKSLYYHIKDYQNLYNKLKDYRSKKLLFAILFNWYDYDFKILKDLMDNTYIHYFDLDILKCENEVFVDIGAYTGDTTLDFINSYGRTSYQAIHCYEMSEKNYNKLVENTKNYPNIFCHKKAISDKKEILYLSESKVDSSADKIQLLGSNEVEVTSLDEDLKEKITIIKMDIEGSEKKALKGAINHIKDDHPKLLISVYHNHEDLWKIPKIIDGIDSNYQYYLRFYGSNIFPTEIVLFAIHN